MTVRVIGHIGDTAVEEISLTGPGALSAHILTFGARLAALKVPDSAGRVADIVVGHDRLEDWVATTTFAGATCGRYANRIAGEERHRAEQLLPEDFAVAVRGPRQQLLALAEVVRPGHFRLVPPRVP